MAELARYAKVYRRFDDTAASSRAGLFFERLAVMDIAAAHPFLLELFARFADAKKEIEATLTCIESFLIRRLVCQLNTRGYNRFFIDLLPELKGPADGLADRVWSRVSTFEADSNRWPRDPEFKAAWRSEPIYIGNLTLLTKKLNSSVSNGPFKAKRKEILKHSALNLNRPLDEWDGWDEGAIQKRSDELFRAVRKIWPAPAE